MTLKEELEILRGESIEIFAGDPMGIPCIETSDQEKLCKHPVVSVQMITYNHEPYIRQAIESVMMQKTDFEFELVIGEDCSQDKTRQICFECQKRHPDKIRVLWWHENLKSVKHPAGSNAARTRAHCRGEFIALCEGDDYWTDPLKLQKQIDVMRRHPTVALCFTAVDRYIQDAGVRVPSTLDKRKTKEYWCPGVVNGCDILARCHGFGTCTVLYRVSSRVEAEKRFEIMQWRLSLGDLLLFCALASVDDMYYMDEVMGVYRVHSGGAMATSRNQVFRDGCLIRLYFMKKSTIPLYQAPELLRSLYYFRGLIAMAQPDPILRRKALRGIVSSKALANSEEILFGVLTPIIFRFEWLLRFVIWYHNRRRWFERILLKLSGWEVSN